MVDTLDFHNAVSILCCLHKSYEFLDRLEQENQKDVQEQVF